MKSDSPHLLAYLNGASERETLLPILARIQARGKARVSVLMPAGLGRRFYRGVSEVMGRGLFPRLCTRKRFYSGTTAQLQSVDAVLVVSDPRLDFTKHKERSELLQQLAVPTIFVQHGVIQQGVNSDDGEVNQGYYSSLLLLWEKGNAEARVLSASSLELSASIGFPKTMLERRAPSTFGGGKWARLFQERLLLCWPPATRYKPRDEEVEASLLLGLEDLLRSYPHSGVIVRTHRGQRVAHIEGELEALRSRHKNLLLSTKSSNGRASRWSMQDCLDYSTFVVAPPSTVLLDAAYQRLPIALTHPVPGFFPEVPSLDSFDPASVLSTDREHFVQASAALRDRYGDPQRNLEVASCKIEAMLAGL